MQTTPTPLTTEVSDAVQKREIPSLLKRSVTLMKPITWFAPMWAFLCGAVASGAVSWSFADVTRVSLGIVMAGPVLCGLSQVFNDYFDRDIDAVNEPHRLIPSGLVSIRQVFTTILILFLLGVGLGFYLGLPVAICVLLGTFLGVLYSAPPVRAKQNGWIGNGLVAISYEGLAWLAGHLAFAALTPASLTVAILFSIGAHGIMSINDYKGIEGDRAGGIRTIPVQLGPVNAAKLIVGTMLFAQICVVIALFVWGLWITPLVIIGLIGLQIPVQRKFLSDPTENYLHFSAV
ncbi:MAG: chlorophyll synthase ChlG, partial [Chloroflexota bacterium]